MAVQVYTDEQLVYDSRLEEYALMNLTVRCSVLKAGTLELEMPPLHPAYNAFTAYRSVVTVYKDGELLWRGRSLHPKDDFYNCRTITGEGERCFLRDGVMRPYLYQDAPAAIFEHVISLYNAQVEAFKQFVVGEVTVTDPNNYIRLESETAEQVADTIDKLQERCGGYIVFTTNAAGQRVINWYAELGYRSNQVIEFGANLMDFARTDSNDDLATVVIPYGAKVETTDPDTGETTSARVTIESVNDGLDFIQDYDAVALRGVIARPVYWDDVSEPANLLAKAQQYLASHKLVITQLELSAVDLSALDKDIASFREGDKVRVRSKPHGVDEDFLLYERTYKLLLDQADTVTLGKEQQTLTGADAAGDKANRGELQRVIHDVRADYQLNVANAVASAVATLSSLIQQTSDAIKLEVSESYATNNELQSAIATSMTQLADSFTFTFNSLQAVVDENDEYARTKFEEQESYIRFIDGKIILGVEGNELTLEQKNDRISFMDQGAEVAYFSNKKLTVTDAHFLNALRIGNFEFQPRENGNLSLVKVVS